MYKEKSSWKNWLGSNILTNLFYFLTFIITFSTFYFTICKTKVIPETIKNVTVFVEDKNHDLILKQQGQVILKAEGGEAKKEDIDSKGSASFKNVKVGDKVDLQVDFSEPYRPLKPDSVYTIPYDGRINLVVSLQNLNRVFGTVIWRDQPLVGVVVVIDRLRDTTNITGNYSISIPEEFQKKKQEVKFLKPGFNMVMRKAFPQTNEPLNIIMEKSR